MLTQCRSLLGPVIGGHLADPAKNFPSLFPSGSVWQTYPYLLPNVVVVMLITTCGILGFLFLEESHPQLKKRPDLGLRISSWTGAKLKTIFLKLKHDEYAPLISDEGQVDEIVDNETSETGDIPPSGSPKRSAYSHQVALQILVVSVFAFTKVAFDVIVPMFLAADKSTTSESNFLKFKSGFGMSLPDLSNILLSQAVVSIMAQILVVPKVLDRWGALKVFRWVVFIFPFLYIVTPFTARLPAPFLIAAILVDLWIKGPLINLGYVASAIL